MWSLPVSVHSRSGVDDETKRLLDAVRHQGQSYDGAIQELAEQHMELSDEAREHIERGHEQIWDGRKVRLSEWR